MKRLGLSNRLEAEGRGVAYIRYLQDYSAFERANVWLDVGSVQSRSDPKIYVVQTGAALIQRCLLMTTDPGDLVLDPTCGSGTTAYVAEQWGRRWITIDTSRVALALARARLMGARYPWYLLKDSPEGVMKEAEVTRSPPKKIATHGDLRQGFVYERVQHITLKSIANNTEIDEIWERMQPAVDAARADLNAALKGHGTPFKVTAGGRAGAKIDFTAADDVELPSGEAAPADGFMEWEIPREAPEGWPAAAKDALDRFWTTRIARQREIDASIAAKADHEYLYDKPYTDKGRVRVAGPFTVETLSPHRVLAFDADDELIDLADAAEGRRENGAGASAADFAGMILENLRAAGLQQAHREDRIKFSSLVGWPGEFICAEGRYMEGETEKRAGVFIGPEFGTVARPDLVAAAREAADAGFDVLIACAFNYDAHAGEFEKLGRVPVLKARMNPDLHMGGELKSTGAGNLFVVFGEPDIDLLTADDGRMQVKINGVDVFKPQTGEIESHGADGIACWFIDTDYDEESFFVRHAYFLGAGDPYKALKTTLKAEIDEAAWDTLHSDTSRPFDRPKSGRIAVKVINHLGDEVMKVFGV
jgi:adenine-specific DNA-methyltransferase